MNETNNPITATIKPRTATSSQTSARTARVSPQAKLPETKPQAAPTQAAPRKVRFELGVPKARSVFVAGTFNHWSTTGTPLLFVGGTRWSKDLSLPPGRYEYQFVVDGKWLEPPQAKAYVPNPHGGRNAVLEL